ncbi:PerC family transcriptional regulator [Raoultella ornithinolytica]|uniref:PerC family transcriptional regulator n=1 Tax=Raoultella ornithinolytica TaxID=54291 RepID=UPI0021AE65B6|nr:PerC family transcriptional regulator [Raoultella ornithinolytica]MCT4737237.1 PerC family transcriptional regulator [Raoultella ornithinolytica]
MINDAVAEKLELAGLWRRAASRWLDLMLLCKTDEEREWVYRRRHTCLSNVSRPVPENKLNIHAINRAASRTQERMGLSRPKGAMFRTLPKS